MALSLLNGVVCVQVGTGLINMAKPRGPLYLIADIALKRAYQKALVKHLVPEQGQNLADVKFQLIESDYVIDQFRYKAAELDVCKGLHLLWRQLDCTAICSLSAHMPHLWTRQAGVHNKMYSRNLLI